MKSVYRGLTQWLGGGRRKDALPALGAREIEVLKLLWERGEMTAQDIADLFSTDQLSLSTMQSTLERLFRKNLVTRCKQGRSYHYAAAVSQRTIISRLMKDIAEQLGNGESAIMISGFMSYIEALPDDHVPEELRAVLNKKSQ